MHMLATSMMANGSVPFRWCSPCRLWTVDTRSECVLCCPFQRQTIFQTMAIPIVGLPSLFRLAHSPLCACGSHSGGSEAAIARTHTCTRTYTAAVPMNVSVKVTLAIMVWRSSISMAVEKRRMTILVSSRPMSRLRVAVVAMCTLLAVRPGLAHRHQFPMIPFSPCPLLSSQLHRQRAGFSSRPQNHSKH